MGWFRVLFFVAALRVFLQMAQQLNRMRKQPKTLTIGFFASIKWDIIAASRVSTALNWNRQTIRHYCGNIQTFGFSLFNF